MKLKWWERIVPAVAIISAVLWFLEPGSGTPDWLRVWFLWLEFGLAIAALHVYGAITDPFVEKPSADAIVER